MTIQAESPSIARTVGEAEVTYSVAFRSPLIDGISETVDNLFVFLLDPVNEVSNRRIREVDHQPVDDGFHGRTRVLLAGNESDVAMGRLVLDPLDQALVGK